MTPEQQRHNLIEAMMWLELEPPNYWLAHGLIQQVSHALSGWSVEPLPEKYMQERAKFFSETAIENAKWSADEIQKRTQG